MIIKSFFRKKITIIYMILLGIVISLFANNYYSYIESTKQIETNYSKSFIQVWSKSKIDFNNEYITKVERIIHGNMYNYIVDKELKKDEAIISEVFKDEKIIGSTIEFEEDQSVTFTVKKYYNTKNEWSEVYISEEMFNSLLEDDKYDYMVKIKSWLMKDKVANMLAESYPNAEISSYEINTSNISYVDFNNNYKMYTYFYLIILIILMIVVVVSILKNEKKDESTYRLLGFNKKQVIKYTIAKILLLLLASIVISIIISTIIIH